MKNELLIIVIARTVRNFAERSLAVVCWPVLHVIRRRRQIARETAEHVAWLRQARDENVIARFQARRIPKEPA